MARVSTLIPSSLATRFISAVSAIAASCAAACLCVCGNVHAEDLTAPTKTISLPLADLATSAALAAYPKDPEARLDYIEGYVTAVLDCIRQGDKEIDTRITKDFPRGKGYHAGLKARKSEARDITPRDYGYTRQALKGWWEELETKSGNESIFIEYGTQRRFFFGAGKYDTLPLLPSEIRVWMGPMHTDEYPTRRYIHGDIIMEDLIHIPPGELAQMVGKNKVQLTEDFGSSLKVLAGVDEFSLNSFFPWIVGGYINSKKEQGYLVMLLQNPQSEDDSCSVQIHLMNPSGNRRNMWKFTAGRGERIKSALSQYDSKLKTHLLTITVTCEFNIDGEVTVATGVHYYSVTDNSMNLIRVENADKDIARYSYSSESSVSGRDLPAHDVEGWTALLESPKVVDQLAALTYLNGVHMNPENPIVHFASQTMDEAEVAKEFRELPSTKKLLQKYRQSPNSWIKEAAEQTLIPAADPNVFE